MILIQIIGKLSFRKIAGNEETIEVFLSTVFIISCKTSYVCADSFLSVRPGTAIRWWLRYECRQEQCRHEMVLSWFSSIQYRKLCAANPNQCMWSFSSWQSWIATWIDMLQKDFCYIIHAFGCYIFRWKWLNLVCGVTVYLLKCQKIYNYTSDPQSTDWYALKLYVICNSWMFGIGIKHNPF